MFLKLCALLLISPVLWAQDVPVEQEPPPELGEEEVLERAPHPLEAVQNENGSFGDKHKSELTSQILLVFLAHGETPKSKRYGKMVKGMIQFIGQQSLARATNVNFELQDIMLMSSLAESYSMTGNYGLIEPLQLLEKRLLRAYELSELQKMNGVARAQLADAIKTYCATDLQQESFTQFRKAWAEDLVTMALNPESEKLSILDKLSLMYQLQIFGEGRPGGEKLYLAAAEEGQRLIKLGTLKGADLFNTYLLTQVLFQHAGKDWKLWNKFYQKQLMRLQQQTGFWLSDDFTANPLEIEWSDAEKDLICTALAGLHLTVFYAYLPTSPKTSEDEIYQQIYPSAYQNLVYETSAKAKFVLGLDLDTASYGNFCCAAQQGKFLPKYAMRVGEWFNYFRYQRPKTEKKNIFTVGFEMHDCPWASDQKLLKMTLFAPELKSRPPANLALLVDCSISMRDTNKLPLVKQSLKLLVEQLHPKDRVSIICYNSTARELLPPTLLTERKVIYAAIDKLEAGGSSNGFAGLELAYQTVQKNFDKKGINRILLCTDGDFNVGVTEAAELKKNLAAQAAKDVFLTVMRFGKGRNSDFFCKQLAAMAKGQAFYIDCLAEARKVLHRELSSTLHTVAKNAQLQLQFDPKYVESYQLIGYDRLQFDKNKKTKKIATGNTMGQGHQMTALYLIKAKPHLAAEPAQGNWLNANFTYRVPGELPSTAAKQLDFTFKPETKPQLPSGDWQHCASQAFLSKILRGEVDSNEQNFAVMYGLAEEASEDLDMSTFRNLHLQLLQGIMTKLYGSAYGKTQEEEAKELDIF